ncbi:MAG: iron ABC transporter permease [Clostridiales bacterium]
MVDENKNRKRRFTIICLGILLVLATVFSFTIGRYPIGIKDVCGAILSPFFPINQYWSDATEKILFNIRLPRILLGSLVGCCLSASGAAYQGVFQNPLAAPDLLGATAGASFGAALGILLRVNGQMITVFAFFFSLVTIALVWLISSKAMGKRAIGFIITGIMVGSLFSAGTSFIKLVADPYDQLPAITYWLMGSLGGATMKDVTFALLPMSIGLLPLLLLRWRINILTLGDDEAQSMGINAKKVRLIVVLAATLVTASSVAVSGAIGWVGLVIPHMARRLVGNNFRYLMPASMLLGALFLLIVDNVSRNLLATEIPLGILTAFIGVPFSIYLIVKRSDIT